MKNKTFLLVLFAAFSMAMSAQITGTVLEDATDFPVIGASVVEVGTTNGVITDFDGNFVLNVAEGTQIEISYMGFAAKTLAAKDGMVVKLEEDTYALQEVVAIGYGSQTKKEITGSVASVKAEDFNKGAFNSAEGLLQGKVAGLTMSKDGGGDPTNRGFSVQIRGTGSLTGSTTPLYIIDGVPGASMNNLNPNDIESMDVLKDGSAAAIYGTRANAGVIIITTKKGKEGKTQVEYTGTISTANTAGRINLYSPEEYVAAGGANFGHQTDWYKEITRVPVSTEHNIALSGGMKNVDYRASVNYKMNQGLAKNSEFQEIMGRASVNQQALNNILEFNYNVSYSKTNSSWVSHSAYQQAMKYNPTMPVYTTPDDPNYLKYGGYFQNFDKSGFSNPVAIVMQPADQGGDQTFLGSVRATIKPVAGLRLSAFGSYQYWNQSTGKYLPSNSVDGNGMGGQASKSNNFNTTRIFEATAQYTNDINNHAFTILAGYAYQDFVSESFGASNTMFPTDDFLYNNLGLGEGLNNLTNGGSKDGIGISSWKEEWKLASAFARINYNYDQKYYLNASIRAEGSSKFGANNRWGYFPSVSAAWRISGEPWMQDVDWIDDLKLRGGWGQTGNQGGIGDYAYLERYSINRQNWWETGKEHAVPTYSQSSLRNTDLTWERTTQTNVGLDWTMFKNRLSLNFDWYYKYTTDMLMWVSLPAGSAAVSSIQRNEGEMSNMGVEFTITSHNFVKKNFKWDTQLNISHNKNRLEKLATSQVYYDAKVTDILADYCVRNTPGMPLGSFFGYKTGGVDPETGELIYLDTNGDGEVTANDRTYMGDPNPDFTFGMTNTFQFYGVTISFLLQGSYGNDIFNASRIETEGMYDAKNQSTRVLDRWRRPGMITSIPKAGFDMKVSDYFVEDGSYIRLKDLTIGYEFSGNWMKKIGMTRLQPYFSAQNLFTLTKYLGMDPEVNQYGNSGTVQGLDYGTYPQTRSFVLGVNIAF